MSLGANMGNVLRVGGVVVLSIVLSVVSVEAQTVGDWFSGLFGPKTLERPMRWSEGNLQVSVTWSETSGKDSSGNTITTVRLQFTNHHDAQVVKIGQFRIQLRSDRDLELKSYSQRLNVTIEPGAGNRVDFQFPVASGLIDDVDRLSGRLAFQVCDANGQNCERPY